MDLLTFRVDKELTTPMNNVDHNQVELALCLTDCSINTHPIIQITQLSQKGSLIKYSFNMGQMILCIRA